MLFVVIHSGKKSPREASVPPFPHASPARGLRHGCHWPCKRCSRERAGKEWRLLALAGILILCHCINGVNASQEPAA